MKRRGFIAGLLGLPLGVKAAEQLSPLLKKTIDKMPTLPCTAAIKNGVPLDFSVYEELNRAKFTMQATWAPPDNGTMLAVSDGGNVRYYELTKAELESMSRARRAQFNDQATWAYDANREVLWVAEKIIKRGPLG